MARAIPASRRWFYLERTLPWVMLFILGVFTFAHFALAPYAGFEFSGDKLILIFPAARAENYLQVGDRLLQVDGLSLEDYFNNRWLPVLSGVEAGQVVPIRVERAGQTLTSEWVVSGVSGAQVLQRVLEMWWLAYVFWMAGTSALLFIRPRDAIWKLLVAFNYLAALWIVTGSGPSHWHILGSAVVLRGAAWLFVPVSWHLNWLFPKPLAHLPGFFWWGIYGLAGTLVALEIFSLTPEWAYEVGFVLAALGIIGLLTLHLILQRECRRQIMPLVIGAAVALVPPSLVVIADLLGIQPSPAGTEGVSGLNPSVFIYQAALLGIVALPGIYFYAVYTLQFGGPRHRLKRLIRLYLMAIAAGALAVFGFGFIFIHFGFDASTFWISLFLVLLAVVISVVGFFPLLALPALRASSAGTSSPGHPELRANRLISIYPFFTIVLALLVPLIVLLGTEFKFPGESVWLALGSVVAGMIATILWFESFQRFVDRRILGISLPPTQILEIYSARITTSLERPALVHLLRDELLPSLLVRQSALFQVGEGQHLVPLYTFGVPEKDLPASAHLAELLRCAEENPIVDHSIATSCTFPWIRMILPLRIQGSLVGLWLLGRRDPDDVYLEPEIEVLGSIANQTAIALINIQQSERLHSLYQADIERQEAERAELALFLHDEVLNQLAALSLQQDSQDIALKIEQTHQHLVSSIRDTIQGLRPAMLNYGLYPALEGLVDELLERVGEKVAVNLDVPASTARYDAKTEQHLYRIVQQACENAIRHAHCQEVCISGRMGKDRVDLEVQDDGMGFPVGQVMDLNELLMAGHFGLAGMFERAALIGAELRIEPAEGGGTRVRLIWANL